MVNRIKNWFGKLTERDLLAGIGYFWITIFFIGIGGYIMNIFKLIGMNELSVKFFLRIVGIFAAPFGSLMGFL